MADSTQPNSILKFVKMIPEVRTPRRGTPLSAGLDLYTVDGYIIQPQASVLIRTYLKVELPEGTYGHIVARSSYELRDVHVYAGIIDNDFRGELKILVINQGDTPFQINQDTRVAQLICPKIEYPVPLEVTELTETDRGIQGFGSTGNH